MDIPLWMWRYAESVIEKYQFDSSHDLCHLVRVYTYAKEIVTVDYYINGNYFQALIPGLTNPDAEKAIYHAAFCHDLVDDKYVDTETEMARLQAEFNKHSYPEKQWRAVEYLIRNISFSKQRRPDFQPVQCYQLALEIVSDADKLDAYRPERVIAFQATRQTENREIWIKTVLVKRVLQYREKWLKTPHAIKLSQPLHDALVEFVQQNYADVEMTDY